jgi:hypothetical protein
LGESAVEQCQPDNDGIPMIRESEAKRSGVVGTEDEGRQSKSGESKRRRIGYDRRGGGGRHDPLGIVNCHFLVRLLKIQEIK